jgi:single-strand DNA-binding protein
LWETWGGDPEVRTTQGGQKVVNLSLATSETWTDRQGGERKERTEWQRVVIFNDRIGELAERFLRKGRKVYFKALCKLGNGPIKAVRNAIRPKW